MNERMTNTELAAIVEKNVQAPGKDEMGENRK
jgi:hypothetical protein